MLRTRIGVSRLLLGTLLACGTHSALQAQPPVARVIYTSPQGFDNVVLRSISDDGGYVAHVATYLYRDNNANVAIWSRSPNLAGKVWPTGMIQAVRNVSDGNIAMVISQRFDDPNNKAAFAAPLKDNYEQKLYGVGNLNLRLPVQPHSKAPGMVRSTYFGEPHRFRVVLGKDKKGIYPVGEFDVQTRKQLRQYRVDKIPDEWDAREAYHPALYNHAGFAYNRNNIFHIHDFTGRRFGSLQVDATENNKLQGMWSGRGSGGIWFGNDETLLANYRPGIIHWSFRGDRLALVKLDPARWQRYVALVGPNLAFVANRDGELLLIDLQANKVIDKKQQANATFTLASQGVGRLQTADSGKYVCLQVSDARQILCYRIEQNRIMGPWTVKHPAGNNLFGVNAVVLFKCSRLAPRMVIETYVKPNTRELLAVDLQALTQAKPQKPGQPVANGPPMPTPPNDSPFESDPPVKKSPFEGN